MAWVTWRQHRIALARAAVRVDRLPPPPRGLMHPRHAGPLRFDGE